MITEATVLILGAGASVDYGFPTGRKLLLEICEQTQPNHSVFHLLTDRMEYSGSHTIENFRKALQFSGAPSVDLFLENRKEFEEIGKLAIAATLIPYEDYERLKIGTIRRWYEILFGLMTEGENFEHNQLSVITFNYDRSLEAFLFQALQNLYGLDPVKANDLLGKIPIVHLYGSLGAGLVSQHDERGYSPELKGNYVAEAAKRIKIVHEAEPNMPEFDRADRLLKGASEIIFLGFGFHRRNVERLKLQENRNFYAFANGKESRILACRTGMGAGDIMRVRNYLPASVEFSPDESWDISEYLSNTQCLNTYLPPRDPPHRPVKVVTK